MLMLFFIAFALLLGCHFLTGRFGVLPRWPVTYVTITDILLLFVAVLALGWGAIFLLGHSASYPDGP